MSALPDDNQIETSATPAAEKDDSPPETMEAEAAVVEDWQNQRDEHKKSADQAFRVGGFKTALDQYTKAISLDPEFVVLYSNRSAAFLANGEKSKALRDARKCIELDISFVKGHSRLAAALLALKRFEQAKDSYEYVLDKDPKNSAASKGVEVCAKEITKRMTLEEQKCREEERQREEAMESTNKSAKEEEEDRYDEDDLLNDFFDEVEEVVAKKKEASALSTNAIRNDRETLGTTKDQIERLLQPRYEWRNLNPYFVLQLTAATATDDDISRRYKALSLLLHPDKNRSKLSEEAERDRAQLAYDQVQKAKIILTDADRKRYMKALVEEGMKQGESRWKGEQQQRQKGNDGDESLQFVQDREVMRIFALVEQKRREVEGRERNFEQRERQQEDDQVEKERKERKFDKQWRDKNRVDKRVGNWRDFDTQKKRKL